MFSRSVLLRIASNKRIFFKNGPRISFSTATSPNSDAQRLASIELTEKCVDRLKELSRVNKDRFLRISVEGGGCSGFQYLFNLDTKLNEDDCLVEKQGAKIVIDHQSLEFLEGATIDYHSELIRSAFRVLKNPKAESGCSCGSSFSLKIM